MGLNQQQLEQLLKPINAKRVQVAQGMSHVAAYDVAAHLTRIFGFGNWEKHIQSLSLVCEDGIEKNGRKGWSVTYRCEMTLVIKDPAGEVIWSGDDAATGSASNLPSRGDAHDFAVKNAVSYALKRCAKDWGDQFGLSLYNKGSLNALVVATLDKASDTAADVQSDLPELHPDDDSGPDEAESLREPRPASAAARTRRAPADREQAPAPPAPLPATDPDPMTELDWMSHVVDDLVPAATTRSELTRLWDLAGERAAKGGCSEEHARQVRAVVTQRAAELGFEKEAAA